MVLHFNVTGETRKQMVKAAEAELGVKAKYFGVPSCAYQVDIFTIGNVNHGDKMYKNHV